MKKVLWLLLISAFLVSCGAPAAKTPTADDVMVAFKAAGLEAENPRDLTKDDYGLAPYVCSGKRFFIPSLGPDNGGRIFVCGNDADRDKLSTFYKKLGEGSALLFSWVYVKGSIVVQINGDLKEDKAAEYEKAIP